jgi:hypothetical protein
MAGIKKQAKTGLNWLELAKIAKKQKKKRPRLD